MKIWKNTSALGAYEEGLKFTKKKELADIAVIGSRPIKLNHFKNLKAIFKAGIGKDNISNKNCKKMNILVRYPSKKLKI